MSRKEQFEKDKKAFLQKEIVTKNPIFVVEQVEELYNLFYLYADPRSKRADVRDVLMTAKTLGLDQKYAFVYRALEEIADSPIGSDIDIETFLKELTNRIVLPLSLRATHSRRKGERPRSNCSTCSRKRCSNWKTCASSTNSCGTASARSSSSTSSKTWAASRPRTSPSTAGTSTSSAKSTKSNLKICDALTKFNMD